MARAASKTARTSEQGLVIERRFTTAGVHPYDELEWETRDAVIGDPEAPAFEQRDVEFPTTWSQNATNIVAQKYFRGQPGSPERERSVRQMVDRVAGRIAEAGREAGYFSSDDDADAFEAELTHILVNQKAAFNSPVWFNVGWKPPGEEQASACFILSVEDDMDSILSWNTKEGIIFKGGSGSGINLSKIRGSMEPLSKGGIASGPVSFMRGADSWAGAIKSGGGTRRAAKMVVLDVDHPDIEKFIWCKADEEKKAAALKAADFDMRLDSDAFDSVQFQNANNSVRVTDEFMQAVENDEDWDLVGRVDGKPVKTIKARELMDQIADAAWQCADPGIQYDTTINRWHTDPNTGPITASNPCSEYMSIDDSACNLASLNLMKFRNEDGSFDVDDFVHAVDIVFLAQEILVGFSSYPTEEITQNARAFRQLGLGYANLGALLMSNGLPYDSDEGRSMAGAITALMTGRGYRKSAEIAGAIGPYNGYEVNREPHNQVMRMHQSAAYEIDDELVDEPLLHAARKSWDEAVALGEQHGYRNAQATVLAPTGTISFLMDCDTTGIEPDFSLVKFKELVGGGQMTIVNQTVGLALETLGYSAEAAAAIEPTRPVRRRMPTERQSLTHKFSIGGHEGYITAGEYEDGTVGEIFLTDVGKEGSTIKGLMNAFATAVSIGLQYGVPLETFVRKFAYMRFEPEGYTGNPEIPFAKSMPDYIMRWVASRYGDAELQEELGILTPEVRARKAAEAATPSADTARPPEPANGGNGHAGGGAGDSAPKPAA